jgi:hypothetical protein
VPQKATQEVVPPQWDSHFSGRCQFECGELLSIMRLERLAVSMKLIAFVRS